MRLADSEAIAALLRRHPDVIRSWASRYPTLLPRRGRDKDRRTLYAIEDARKLAPLVDARVALTEERKARHTGAH